MNHTFIWTSLHIRCMLYIHIDAYVCNVSASALSVPPACLFKTILGLFIVLPPLRFSTLGARLRTKMLCEQLLSEQEKIFFSE